VRKATINSGLALAVGVGIGVGYFVPWLAEHIRIKPIEQLTTVSVLNEHQEAEEFDKTVSPDTISTNLSAIHLGDLSVPCPICRTEVDVLHVGMSVLEDRQTETGDLNELLSIGVVVYPCGHVTYSPLLSDKVASILNAEEIGRLSPSLFMNLGEEHEV
jgi:hypothetical protein